MVVLIVKGSIASLKVAVIALLMATAVAAFAGMVELTVGGMMSKGTLIVLATKVTATCASALPFSVAPEFITITVAHKMLPLNTDVVPSVVWPATCQKMFFGCAPPLKTTCAAELTTRVCAIWNIHTAVEFPERMTAVGIVTPVPHL